MAEEKLELESPDDVALAERLKEARDQILVELRKLIVGQDEVVDQVLAVAVEDVEEAHEQLRRRAGRGGEGAPPTPQPGPRVRQLALRPAQLQAPPVQPLAQPVMPAEPAQAPRPAPAWSCRPRHPGSGRCGPAERCPRRRRGAARAADRGACGPAPTVAPPPRRRSASARPAGTRGSSAGWSRSPRTGPCRSTARSWPRPCRTSGRSSAPWPRCAAPQRPGRRARRRRARRSCGAGRRRGGTRRSAPGRPTRRPGCAAPAGSSRRRRACYPARRRSSSRRTPPPPRRSA